MRRKYLNTTGMGATTAAYMNQNQTIWAGNKAVTDTMAQVNAALGTVDAKAQAQETPIVGDEELKVLTRHDYEDEIMRIAGQVCSMATKAGDTVTAGQTEFTLSQLDKMSADDLERAGKRVSGLATASLAGLADYNITQTDVTGLDGMTAQFDKVKTGPRTAIATRGEPDEDAAAGGQIGGEPAAESSGQADADVQEEQSGILRGLLERAGGGGPARQGQGQAHAHADPGAAGQIIST